MASNKIQFWLSRGSQSLRLPVNPESISISSPFGFEDVPVAQLGEITLIGERLQKEATISSFFPRDYNASYCEYTNIPDPWDVVKLIEDLRDKRLPVRFTMTGTPISFQATVRDFEIEPERAGSPGDIYYTISLKEFKEVTLRKLGEKATVRIASVRPTSGATTPKTHVVKAGDNLSKLALKVYGDSSKYTKIYEANKVVIGKNPNLIMPGQRLVIPS